MNKLKQVAIALLVGLLFIVFYFKPIFFEGKHLTQHDLMQGRGAGKEINDFRKEKGEEALWTNSMFGGMPMYLVSTKFSGNWVQQINYRLFRFLPATADVVFVNFICMFILLMTFRQNVWVSLLGGLLYGFSTFTLLSVQAGHIYKVLAMGYAPLVIAGINLVFRKRYLLGAAVSALAISLELTSKHYQITFYLIIVALIYFVSLLIFIIKKEGVQAIWKPVLVLIGAAILAVGPNVGDVWTTLEYSKVSIRGEKELSPLKNSNQEKVSAGLDKDYAFAWSQGKWESFTYVIPKMYGGSSSEKLGKDSETYKAVYKATRSQKKSSGFVKALPVYWGPQSSTGGPHYVGVVIVFFFVLGCFILKPEVKYWLIAGMFLTLMIGWGSNFESFNYFLFDYVPGFNKFRAVAMALTLTAMLLIVMGALSLGELIKEGGINKYSKQIKNAFLTTAGLIVVVWVGTYTMDFVANSDVSFKAQTNAQILDALQQDRVSILKQGALRSLLFLGLVALVVWLFSAKRITTNVMLYLVLTVALMDLTIVNWGYFGHKYEKYTKKTLATSFTPSKADKFILEDKSLDYRVLDLNNTFNNSLTSYYHKSIGGYSGVKMQRYQDLIERQITPEMNAVIGSLQNQGQGMTGVLTSNQVLNMLNTKYVIYNPEAQPIKNDFANGNAWFVKTVKPVNSANEEMAQLNSNNLKEVAVVDVSKFKTAKTTYATEGEISLQSYEPNNLKYVVEAKDDALVVFSEIYYDKGWDAYLDGEKVDYIRADYILRALEVPQGKHKIEFKFEPNAYVVGNKIALFSSIILILLLIIGIWDFIKKEQESI